MPAPPRPLSFAPDALTSLPADELLVSLSQVEVPGRLNLGHLNVHDGARLLVTGVRRHPDLRVGLLAQDTEFANPRLTPRGTSSHALGAERVEQVPLESLGLLHKRDLGKPVGALSAGQRRRLAPGAILLASHDRWLRRRWQHSCLNLERVVPSCKT